MKFTKCSLTLGSDKLCRDSPRIVQRVVDVQLMTDYDHTRRGLVWSLRAGYITHKGAFQYRRDLRNISCVSRLVGRPRKNPPTLSIANANETDVSMTVAELETAFAGGALVTV